MIYLVKKAMFTGIGVMSLTKEKIEDIAGEFVAQGKLSEQEGKKMVNDLLERSEESKGALKKQIEAVVKSTLAKMDVATKSDMESLKSDMADLRESLKGKEK